MFYHPYFCNILAFVSKKHLFSCQKYLTTPQNMRSDLVTKRISLNPVHCCIRYLSKIHYNKGDIFMFNSFSWQSHDEYHINFKKFKAKLSSDLRVLLWNSYSEERHKLMSLNLGISFPVLFCDRTPCTPLGTDPALTYPFRLSL